jgi:enterochelin esterase-like enzyme
MNASRHRAAAILFFGLASAVYSSGDAAAQSVADRFHRLDTNGDGVLDAAEAGTLGFFRPADTDGDGVMTKHDLRKLNGPILVPLTREAGVQWEYREYPGYGHGFYFGGGDDRWGKGADERLVTDVVRDVRDVLDRAMPPASDLAWVTREIKAPGVSFHTFESVAAKARVSYHLFTPATYGREPEQRFPVVYWLHGSGGGLPGIPQVAARFARAIEAGKTPPCLVVFVNGMPNGMYVDWKDGSAPLETVIVRELVPHVDASYRTIAGREGRLLDGYSMGGYGAARLGFQHSDLFRSISIMGGGPLQENLLDAPRAGRRRAMEVLERVYGADPDYFRSVSPRTLAERHRDALTQGSLIRVVCGDRDDTFANNRDFHEHLERLGIPHTWTVLPGIGHDPLGTLEALGDAHWAFYRQAFGAPPDR